MKLSTSMTGCGLGAAGATAAGAGTTGFGASTALFLGWRGMAAAVVVVW